MCIFVYILACIGAFLGTRSIYVPGFLGLITPPLTLGRGFFESEVGVITPLGWVYGIFVAGCSKIHQAALTSCATDVDPFSSQLEKGAAAAAL